MPAQAQFDRGIAPVMQPVAYDVENEFSCLNSRAGIGRWQD